MHSRTIPRMASDFRLRRGRALWNHPVRAWHNNLFSEKGILEKKKNAEKSKSQMNPMRCSYGTLHIIMRRIIATHLLVPNFVIIVAGQRRVGSASWVKNTVTVNALHGLVNRVWALEECRFRHWSCSRGKGTCGGSQRGKENSWKLHRRVL